MEICEIFCIFVKNGISFSYKYDITLLSKKTTNSDVLLPKNTLEDEFSVSLKKMTFIIENMVFPLIEKLKMKKKFI